MITLTPNRRPHPCKGCVITTTLRKQAKYLGKIISPYVPQKSSFLTLFLKFWAAAFVLSRFLFRGMVRNRIPTVCFYICSTQRNSELFSLQLKGSEGILRVGFYFCFHGMEFRVVFLFRRRVRNGILRFFVPRNSRNSVRNNHLFRIFRLPQNYFFVGNSQHYSTDPATPESWKVRVARYSSKDPCILDGQDIQGSKVQKSCDSS
jgi:hypothetical protein